MKIFFKVVSLSLILLLCLIIQIYVLNNLTFLGITANIFLCFITLIAIFIKPNISIPFAFITGIICDLIFTFTLGKYLITYVTLVIAVIVSTRIYNKQNIGVIVISTTFATIICQVIFLIFNLIASFNMPNVLYILEIIVKESLLNICISLLCFKAIKKIGEQE